MKPDSKIRRAWRSLFGADRDNPASSQGDTSPAKTGLPPFDPLHPGFVNDPYPYLEQLQELEPVHRSLNGAWVLTRYEDVLAALSDRRLGNSPSLYAVVNKRNRERFTCADVANNIIPFLDVPDHTPPRKIVARAFAGFLNDAAIDFHTLAREALAGLGDRGGDGVKDFATPYALRVISTILGVPREDEERLKRWSETFFYLFSIIPSEEVRNRLDRDLEEFRAYFTALLRERAARPENDLLSRLAAVASEGEGLGDREIVDHCMLLFSDGVENVDSGIANGLYTLLRHPEQFDLLRSRRELVKPAVEECLRFEAPGQFIGRVVLEDFQLRGVALEKNAGVLLVIGAANRDPRHFDGPHRFDIRRTPNAHLSFGKGLHSCIGAPLVRLEMEAALDELLELPRRVELAQPAAEWERRLGHRWIARLPLSFS